MLTLYPQPRVFGVRFAAPRNSKLKKNIKTIFFNFKPAQTLFYINYECDEMKIGFKMIINNNLLTIEISMF